VPVTGKKLKFMVEIELEYIEGRRVDEQVVLDVLIEEIEDMAFWVDETQFDVVATPQAKS
jgi:hypothetical protein